MRKGLVLGIVLMIGLIGNVSGLYDSSENIITIPIHKGWNLVPTFAGEVQSQDSPIKVNDFKYRFIYSRSAKKYILTPKDGENYLGDESDLQYISNEDNTYLLYSSSWVYSEEEGELKLRWRGINDVLKDISNLDLIEGWNFIFVNPEMRDKSLNDMKGSCDYERVYTYAKEGGVIDWMDLLNNPNFMDEGLTDNSVGYGLLIKVSGDCTMGSSGGNPPELPGDEGCSDSDGGNSYYEKGLVETSDESVWDYCDEDTLYEFNCYEHGGALDTYVCPNGCSDGACVGGDGGWNNYLYEGDIGYYILENAYDGTPQTEYGVSHIHYEAIYSPYAEGNVFVFDNNEDALIHFNGFKQAVDSEIGGYETESIENIEVIKFDTESKTFHVWAYGNKVILTQEPENSDDIVSVYFDKYGEDESALYS